jgi:hypothetical protein
VPSTKGHEAPGGARTGRGLDAVLNAAHLELTLRFDRASTGGALI